MFAVVEDQLVYYENAKRKKKLISITLKVNKKLLLNDTFRHKSSNNRLRYKKLMTRRIYKGLGPPFVLCNI